MGISDRAATTEAISMMAELSFIITEKPWHKSHCNKYHRSHRQQ